MVKTRRSLRLNPGKEDADDAADNLQENKEDNVETLKSADDRENTNEGAEKGAATGSATLVAESTNLDHVEQHESNPKADQENNETSKDTETPHSTQFQQKTTNDIDEPTDSITLSDIDDDISNLLIEMEKANSSMSNVDNEKLDTQQELAKSPEGNIQKDCVEHGPDGPAQSAKVAENRMENSNTVELDKNLPIASDCDNEIIVKSEKIEFNTEQSSLHDNIDPDVVFVSFHCEDDVISLSDISEASSNDDDTVTAAVENTADASKMDFVMPINFPSTVLGNNCKCCPNSNSLTFQASRYFPNIDSKIWSPLMVNTNAEGINEYYTKAESNTIRQRLLAGCSLHDSQEFVKNKRSVEEKKHIDALNENRKTMQQRQKAPEENEKNNAANLNSQSTLNNDKSHMSDTNNIQSTTDVECGDTDVKVSNATPNIEKPDVSKSNTNDDVSTTSSKPFQTQLQHSCPQEAATYDNMLPSRDKILQASRFYPKLDREVWSRLGVCKNSEGREEHYTKYEKLEIISFLSNGWSLHDAQAVVKKHRNAQVTMQSDLINEQKYKVKTEKAFEDKTNALPVSNYSKMPEKEKYAIPRDAILQASRYFPNLSQEIWKSMDVTINSQGKYEFYTDEEKKVLRRKLLAGLSLHDSQQFIKNLRSAEVKKRINAITESRYKAKKPKINDEEKPADGGEVSIQTHSQDVVIDLDDISDGYDIPSQSNEHDKRTNAEVVSTELQKSTTLPDEKSESVQNMASNPTVRPSSALEVVTSLSTNEISDADLTKNPDSVSEYYTKDEKNLIRIKLSEGLSLHDSQNFVKNRRSSNDKELVDIINNYTREVERQKASGVFTPDLHLTINSEGKEEYFTIGEKNSIEVYLQRGLSLPNAQDIVRNRRSAKEKKRITIINGYIHAKQRQEANAEDTQDAAVDVNIPTKTSDVQVNVQTANNAPDKEAVTVATPSKNDAGTQLIETITSNSTKREKNYPKTLYDKEKYIFSRNNLNETVTSSVAKISKRAVVEAWLAAVDSSSTTTATTPPTKDTLSPKLSNPATQAEITRGFSKNNKQIEKLNTSTEVSKAINPADINLDVGPEQFSDEEKIFIRKKLEEGLSLHDSKKLVKNRRSAENKELVGIINDYKSEMERQKASGEITSNLHLTINSEGKQEYFTIGEKMTIKAFLQRGLSLQSAQDIVRNRRSAKEKKRITIINGYIQTKQRQEANARNTSGAAVNVNIQQTTNNAHDSEAVKVSTQLKNDTGIKLDQTINSNNSPRRKHSTTLYNKERYTFSINSRNETVTSSAAGVAVEASRVAVDFSSTTPTKDTSKQIPKLNTSTEVSKAINPADINLDGRPEQYTNEEKFFIRKKLEEGLSLRVAQEIIQFRRNAERQKRMEKIDKQWPLPKRIRVDDTAATTTYPNKSTSTSSGEDIVKNNKDKAILDVSRNAAEKHEYFTEKEHKSIQTYLQQGLSLQSAQEIVKNRRSAEEKRRIDMMNNEQRPPKRTTRFDVTSIEKYPKNNQIDMMVNEQRPPERRTRFDVPVMETYPKSNQIDMMINEQRPPEKRTSFDVAVMETYPKNNQAAINSQDNISRTTQAASSSSPIKTIQTVITPREDCSSVENFTNNANLYQIPTVPLNTGYYCSFPANQVQNNAPLIGVDRQQTNPITPFYAPNPISNNIVIPTQSTESEINRESTNETHNSATSFCQTEATQSAAEDAARKASITRRINALIKSGMERKKAEQVVLSIYGQKQASKVSENAEKQKTETQSNQQSINTSVSGIPTPMEKKQPTLENLFERTSNISMGSSKVKSGPPIKIVLNSKSDPISSISKASSPVEAHCNTTSDKNIQNDQNQPKSQTSSETQKQDSHYKVQIVHERHPLKYLTDSCIDEIKQSLLNEIDNVEDLNADLGFHDCKNKDGSLLLTCNNEETKNWLSKIIKTLKPFPKNYLRIIRQNDERIFLCLTHISAADVMPFSQLQLRLQKQNAGLSTKDWRILKTLPVADGGENLIISIDELSKEKILAQQGKLFLNFSQITVKIRDKLGKSKMPIPKSSESHSVHSTTADIGSSPDNTKELTFDYESFKRKRNISELSEILYEHTSLRSSDLEPKNAFSTNTDKHKKVQDWNEAVRERPISSKTYSTSYKFCENEEAEEHSLPKPSSSNEVSFTQSSHHSRLNIEETRIKRSYLDFGLNPENPLLSNTNSPNDDSNLSSTFPSSTYGIYYRKPT